MPIFNADDGKHAYFVSANDIDHAKQILHNAEVKLHDPHGNLQLVHHPSVCHPTMWMELDERTANRVTLHGMTKPVSTLRIGQWRLIVRKKADPISADEHGQNPR